MVLLRKIGSGILFVVAIITFLLCATGVIGSWFAKITLDQTTIAGIELVNGYLGLAIQTVQNVDSGLAEAERTLATVQSSAQNLRSGGPDGPMVAVVRQTVSEDLVPRLDRLATGARSAHTALQGLGETLDRLNSIPLVSVPSVDSQLEALDTRIAEASAQAGELRAAIDNLDGARVTAVSARIEERLTNTRAVLGTANQRLSGVQATLTDISEAFTIWSTVGAGVLSVLMFLFALGQASLAAHAWGWMRAK